MRKYQERGQVELDFSAGMPFTYSLEAQDHLRASLSPERLTRYLKATNGNLHRAIHLYEANTRLAEALHGVLETMEIVLRNALHAQLEAGVGKAEWYDYIDLRNHERSSIEKAKGALNKRDRPLQPGRIVAELSLGFWSKLTCSGYEKQLWVPFLHRAFPGQYKPNRVLTYQRLEDLNQLRNRVAHHEPIFQRDLTLDHTRAIETIAWLSPVVSVWVGARTRFPHLLSLFGESLPARPQDAAGAE